MALNENVVTGRKYRHCTDVQAKLWERISFWKKASDVEFDDGRSAQIKIGSIKGITTSKNVTDVGYVADATVITDIYNKISSIKNSLNKRLDSN